MQFDVGNGRLVPSNGRAMGVHGITSLEHCKNIRSPIHKPDDALFILPYLGLMPAQEDSGDS